MKLKSDNKNNFSKNETNAPNYIKYLIGLAILLFAIIVGYNAFVVPDVDNTVKITADSMDFKEEKTSLDKTKTNINKAGKEELKKLSGIGEQTALKIIDYREIHGGFSSKEELMEVSGIGEKIFKKVKNNITV